MEIKKIILSLSVISLFNCPAMNPNTMDLGAIRANLPKISLRDAPAYIERAKTLLQASTLSNDQKLALIGQLNSLPQHGAKVKVGLANVLNTWNDYVTPGGTSRTIPIAQTPITRGRLGGFEALYGQFQQPRPIFQQPQPQPIFQQPQPQPNNITVFGRVELAQLGEDDIAAESVRICSPDTGEPLDITQDNLDELDLSLTCLALSEIAGNDSYDNNLIEALRRSIINDLNYGVFGNIEYITNLYNVFIADHTRKAALERALGDQGFLLNKIQIAYDEHRNDGGNNNYRGGRNPNLIAEIDINNGDDSITINLQNINSTKVSDCMKALQQVRQQQQQSVAQIYDQRFEDALQGRVLNLFSAIQNAELTSIQDIAPGAIPAVSYDLAYTTYNSDAFPDQAAQAQGRILIASVARQTARSLGLSSEEVWDIYSLLGKLGFVDHHLVELMQKFYAAYFYGVVVNSVKVNGMGWGIPNYTELDLPGTLAALKTLLKEVPNVDVVAPHTGIFENNKKRPNPALVECLVNHALQLISSNALSRIENADDLDNMLSNYFPNNEDSLCVGTPYNDELSTVRISISEEHESRQHRMQVVDEKRELFNTRINGAQSVIDAQRALDEHPVPEGNRPEVPVYPVPDVGNQPEVPENLRNSIANVQSDNIESLNITINELNTWLGENRDENDENRARNPDQQGLYDYIISEKRALEYDRLTALHEQAQNEYYNLVRPAEVVRDAALEKYMNDPDIEDNAMQEYLNSLQLQIDNIQDIINDLFPIDEE